MALTSKLGISDSLLANVELAFAGADPTLPAITTQGGSLGGQLGDTILALAEVDGSLTVNLSAESVLALAQSADPAPVIAPHASPDWVLGGHDSQLGGLVPAFDGAPATLPTTTTQTGLLGTPLGAVVPGLDGTAGPMVFNLSAASVLSLLQTADPAPVIAPHASANWALGGQDSYLGGMTLAYAGLADARPFTTGLTGKLGTADSLLAGVRLALGLQEGEGTGGIVNADAASELSLSSEAAMAVARSAAASSTISLTSAAARNNLLSAAAESVVSLIVDAGRNNLLAATGDSAIDLTSEAGYSVAWAIAAESQISLTDAAGRNNLLSAVAESTISVSATAVEKVVRVLAAESVLSLTHEAANTGRTIYEVAAGSSLDLTSAASTAVAWAVAAADTLELTDQAGRNDLLAAVAESTISLTSEAERNSFPAVIAESAISLTSQAWHQQIVEMSAESAISLTSEAERNSFPAAAAESALSLSDEAARTHIIGHRGEVWDWIELYDWAEVSVVRALVAESRIELVQTEHTARPWYVSAESPVQIATPEYDPEVDDIVLRLEGLQDVASVARPLTADARHSIPLHQTAGVVLVKPTAIDVSAESVLDLLGEVRINPTGRAVDWLALHHEAAVDRSKLVKSVLDLSQEAAVIVSVPRGAASALGLTQAATFSIVSRGSLQSYTPFVGEGPGPTPPPVTIGPPEHVALPFQLFYPAGGVVTDSVTLRAPNLGNKDRLSFNRILRETRGGTLIVFADPIWPKIQTLVLTFSGLRSVQVQQLLTFLETHLGEEIGLLDWEGRIWNGIVTAPEEPVVQDGKDSFSASLEFEGELVPA